MDTRTSILPILIYKPQQNHKEKPILNLSKPIPVKAPLPFGFRNSLRVKNFYVVSKRGFQ